MNKKNALQFTLSSIYIFFLLLNFILHNGIEKKKTPVGGGGDDGSSMSSLYSTIYINTSQFQLRFSFEFRRRFFSLALCQTNKTLFSCAHSN